MQFVTFSSAANGAGRVGVLKEGRVVALSDLIGDAPDDMIGVIKAGPDLVARARGALEKEAASGIAADDVRFLAPIEKPGKVVCLGLNYAEHAKEGGRDVPEYPTLFLRAQTSLLGPGEDVKRPAASTRLDYEAELLIVIGKAAHRVSEADALDHVFGYSAFNDVSVRDYQRRTSQWTAGKNFDATGPYGPAIVTADALPKGADGLSIRARLNGEIMQDGNTSDMIFKVARTVADISEIMTLEPGDLIATGTPSGVGFARTPPVWLKPGDTIEIEIEGIPTLTNGIVDG